MNRFEKISEKQFKKDFEKYTTVKYDDIKLPIRATKYSAGYDFFAPFDIVLNPNEGITIPTGIRIKLDNDKVLQIYPRSGLGFKYKEQLYNTVGIIDSDYYNSNNEGHIMIKIFNDNREGEILTVIKGTAFAQGIISQYFVTDDDITEGIRNGGFGSTTI